MAEIARLDVYALSGEPQDVDWTTAGNGWLAFVVFAQIDVLTVEEGMTHLSKSKTLLIAAAVIWNLITLGTRRYSKNARSSLVMDSGNCSWNSLGCSVCWPWRYRLCPRSAPRRGLLPR